MHGCTESEGLRAFGCGLNFSQLPVRWRFWGEVGYVFSTVAPPYRHTGAVDLSHSVCDQSLCDASGKLRKPYFYATVLQANALSYSSS